MPDVLLTTDVNKWIVDQVVVQDWYDGPRAGLCRMRVPVVEFDFKLLAERQAAEGPDDRLFTIGILPPGSVDSILSVLDFAGALVSPVWVPRWECSEQSRLEIANHAIELAHKKAIPTCIILRSDDFVTFSGCWKVSDTKSIVDWFEHLGIDKT